MKSRSLPYSAKKVLWFSFTLTLRRFTKYHPPPCSLSRNITKNSDTRPPPMLDVFIEQTLNPYQKMDNLNNSIKKIIENCLMFGENNNMFKRWLTPLGLTCPHLKGSMY